MSIKYNPVSRMKYFAYYTDGDEPLIESINFGKSVEIEEVRLHLSVAMASVEDLIIQLSSILGSAHNILFLSYSMFNHTDLVYQFHKTHKMLYGDVLSVYLSFKSQTNWYGLSILGWEVTG